MEEIKKLFFDSSESFREWLEINYDNCDGIWMVFYKKHTKIKCIDYREALEEALCFGWIDSTIKKVDENKYLRKFTPRKNISNWSEQNKQIVVSLMERGKMTPAGLNKIDLYLKTGRIDWHNNITGINKKKKELIVPGYILEALSANEPALTNFNNLARSYRLQYVMWINSAKREKTAFQRIQEAIELLKQNKKLGIK